VQQDRSINNILQSHRSIDVVVVTMRQCNCFHATSIDCFNDWCSVVCRINHNDFAIITDQPNVVRYFPFAAIKRENSSGIN